ncbi:MAG TPA: Sec-independent protein translocase subunit TatA [Streptosporangiaceae bacterium]|nr:Sec-independent protein translocase subunit TatA [Streptosporangiaceae bacterium]
MGPDLFAPWHIIILLVVILVLFGAKRLPGAAQSLGQSMHIFKRSMKGLHDDDQPADGDATYTQATVVPPAPPQQLATPRPDPAAQAQIDDLQRQVEDLQRLSAAGNGSTSAAEPRNTQSS